MSRRISEVVDDETPARDEEKSLSSFEAFFLKMSPRLRIVADRKIPTRIKPKATPSDLLQDLFVYFYKHPEKLDKKTPEHAYNTLRKALVCRIKNTIRFFSTTQQRDIGREHSFEAMLESGRFDEDAFQSDSVRPVDFSDDYESLESLRAAVQTLPAQTQSIMSMRVEDSLQFKQIAAYFEIPENTVSRKFRRALDTLRDRMRPF